MAVYSWNDLSPVDGCRLVRFVLEAPSVQAVAAALHPGRVSWQDHDGRWHEVGRQGR